MKQDESRGGMAAALALGVITGFVCGAVFPTFLFPCSEPPPRVACPAPIACPECGETCAPCDVPTVMPVPPDEIERLWMLPYQAMQTTTSPRAIWQKVGHRLLTYYPLPTEGEARIVNKFADVPDAPPMAAPAKEKKP